MLHSIRRLDLFVTEACNLDCPYCFTRGGRRAGAPRDQLFAAVEWLLGGAQDRTHLTLWGGEPLLRFSLIEELVAHARRRARELGKKVRFSLPTNATLLDDQVLDWIEENEVQVFLSIDGAEASQAGRPLASGGSSHVLADRGLGRALRRSSTRAPVVRMTVTPESAGRLLEDVRHFWRRGVRELLVHPALDSEWPIQAREVFARGTRAVAEALARSISDGETAVPVIRSWRSVLRRLAVRQEPRPRQGPLRDCQAGRELVSLSVEGSFSPCHRFHFYARRRGDVFSMGDLEQGFREEGTHAFAQLKTEDLRGEGGACVDCDLFDLCLYGCIAINYATSGSLTRVPAAACALARAQVDACRSLHASLADDPRYLDYLSLSEGEKLRATATLLGGRAHQLYYQSLA